MKKYYEVSISIEKVVTYKVEAENTVDAEHKALDKMRREEEYDSILDSSGAIEEISKDEFYD